MRQGFPFVLKPRFDNAEKSSVLITEIRSNSAYLGFHHANFR